jgi:hypothetical protein
MPRPIAEFESSGSYRDLFTFLLVRLQEARQQSNALSFEELVHAYVPQKTSAETADDGYVVAVVETALKTMVKVALEYLIHQGAVIGVEEEGEVWFYATGD